MHRILEFSRGLQRHLNIEIPQQLVVCNCFCLFRFPAFGGWFLEVGPGNKDSGSKCYISETCSSGQKK